MTMTSNVKSFIFNCLWTHFGGNLICPTTFDLDKGFRRELVVSARPRSMRGAASAPNMVRTAGSTILVSATLKAARLATAN